MIGVDILGMLIYETWKMGHMPVDLHLKMYQVKGIGFLTHIINRN